MLAIREGSGLPKTAGAGRPTMRAVRQAHRGHDSSPRDLSHLLCLDASGTAGVGGRLAKRCHRWVRRLVLGFHGTKPSQGAPLLRTAVARHRDGPVWCRLPLSCCPRFLPSDGRSPRRRGRCDSWPHDHRQPAHGVSLTARHGLSAAPATLSHLFIAFSALAALALARASARALRPSLSRSGAVPRLFTTRAPSARTAASASRAAATASPRRWRCPLRRSGPPARKLLRRAPSAATGPRSPRQGLVRPYGAFLLARRRGPASPKARRRRRQHRPGRDLASRTVFPLNSTTD